MLNVILEHLAEQELNNASDYYDEKSPGLGSDFVAAVKSGCRQIARSPETWPVLMGNIRKYIIGSFPFSIYYRYDDEFVYVLAIPHHRRKPLYWIDRI